MQVIVTTAILALGNVMTTKKTPTESCKFQGTKTSNANVYVVNQMCQQSGFVKVVFTLEKRSQQKCM